MVFKKFFWKSLLTALAIATAWVGVNVYVDEFGIFRDVKNRELRIYGSERLAKYLYSLHYIPAKFNGVLLGPSLSDIIDTREMKSCAIYNMSLTGGNASELRTLFENVAAKNRNLKAVVICIDPFITRKTGMEEVEMNSQLFWSALGSTSFIKYYQSKYRSLHGKAFPDMSTNTEWGRYHYLIFRPKSARQMIEEYSANPDNQKPADYGIDPAALADLARIVSLARQHNVRVLAYYHPYPQKVYERLKGIYQAYQRKINGIFGAGDLVYDFNDDKYRDLRSDYSNYLDTVHLSDKGAAFVAAELDRLVATWPDNLLYH